MSSTTRAQPAGRPTRVGDIPNIPGGSPLADMCGRPSSTANESLVIERRYAELRKEASQAAVEELIRVGVDVIVVSSTATALAAKRTTARVPIVATELAGKQVELLNEAVPGVRRIAVLANPGNASHAPRMKEIAEVARALNRWWPAV